MASASFSLLFPALSLLLLASSAAARPGLPFHPCKTLLISTYSISFQPGNLDHPIHTRPEFFAVVDPISGKTLAFFPETPQFRPHQPHGFIRSREHQTLIRRPNLALGSTASLRDRTLDVLNVLSSLLFGAACGALTASTMYLIWSLLHSRFESSRSVDDDFSDADADVFNPKKPLNNKSEGYVAVPAAPSAADSTETPLLNKESV